MRAGRKTMRLSLVAVMTVATVGVLTPGVAGAATTYSETVGIDTHTWTNYTNAGGTEGPLIPRYTTVQVSCRLTGFVVRDGNPWWYRLASPPWSNNFYSSADPFYNNGQTSGDLKGTPWVDEQVPICGQEPPPPPPPAPTVEVAQGPVAPEGYRYAITLRNFPANASVGVSCRDSVDPGGFFDFTIQTDSSGYAFTQSHCYSADGPDHWVIANGIESNHVSWSGGGSSSGGDGSSGGASSGEDNSDTPEQSQSNQPSPQEECRQVSGTLVADRGSAAYALYDHYMWGKGKPVVVEWSYFAGSTSFSEFAKGLSDGQRKGYTNGLNTDMFYALGTFTVERTSENCYYIEDHYDFLPSFEKRKLVDTIFTLPQWFYQLSGAREFYVYSSGRL